MRVLNKSGLAFGVVWASFLPLLLAMKTGIRYVGCFVDNYPHGRDLVGLRRFSRIGPYNLGNPPDDSWVLIHSNTVELCSDFCAFGRFRYFSMQTGTPCFCGNSYGIFGAAAESDCNWACPGNNAQMCGGGNRNSVYENFYSNKEMFAPVPSPYQVTTRSWDTTPKYTVSHSKNHKHCAFICSLSPNCMAFVRSQPDGLCYTIGYVGLPIELAAVAGDLWGIH